MTIIASLAGIKRREFVEDEKKQCKIGTFNSTLLDAILYQLDEMVKLEDIFEPDKTSNGTLE